VRWFLWGFLVLFMSSVSAKTVNIEKLTVVYLYQLSRLITWPADKKQLANFNLCLFEDSQRSKLLDSLEAKTIGDKAIKINYAMAADNMQDCHVLFIRQLLNEADYDVIRGLSYQHHILTVSKQIGERKNKAVMIELFKKKQRLRFRVNYSETQTALLEVSSRLLALAAEVRHE